jgi:hypothetical protein
MPLKRKHAFIFASRNNACGAAGDADSLELTAADPPDFIADLILKTACSPPPSGFRLFCNTFLRTDQECKLVFAGAIRKKRGDRVAGDDLACMGMK